MRAAAPALLPVFRSRLQGVLLALILGQPDREWTLEGLATSSREPYQTVSNEVRRLQGAGLVAVRTVGRLKFLQANTASPYFRPLAQLVLMSFGPPLVVSEELATLPGVDQAFIYGSWAARYAGEPGPAPNDVHVLLVGSRLPGIFHRSDHPRIGGGVRHAFLDRGQTRFTLLKEGCDLKAK